MQNITYWPGGYEPDAPAENQRELWDSDAGTYTAFDVDGTVLEERPLTDAELAFMNAAVTAEPDIVTLANQVSDLTDAVNQLIINALGG